MVVEGGLEMAVMPMKRDGNRGEGIPHDGKRPDISLGMVHGRNPRAPRMWTRKLSSWPAMSRRPRDVGGGSLAKAPANPRRWDCSDLDSAVLGLSVMDDLHADHDIMAVLLHAGAQAPAAAVL